jgi:hypothetical protein
MQPRIAYGSTETSRSATMATKTQVNVLICVPSIRGTVMCHTMVSIARTSFLLAQLGIPNDVINIDSAEITVARNTMASHALRQPHVTHLLFVDDDMSFEADAVVDLLRADKPVIGFIYPKRLFRQEEFFKATRAGKSFEEASTAALEFVHRMLPNPTLSITEGLCPVAGIGMGLCLIKMSTFREMLDKNVVNKPELSKADQTGDMFAGQVFGFFDPIYSNEAGRYLSEDLSFCERWTQQCGGEVWAKVDRKIGHIGQQMFAGTFLDRLKTGEI